MPTTKPHAGTYSELLAEIQAAQADHAQRALELASMRRRYVPVRDEADHRRRGEAEKEIEAIAQAEAQLAERATAIEEMWARAVTLDDETGRLSGDDDEVRDQINALETRRTLLQRDHEGRHREDAIERLKASQAAHLERFEAFAAQPDPRMSVQFTAAYVMSRDEFTDAALAAIDKRTDFASGSRDEYRRQRDRLKREIDRRRHELALRDEEAAVAEAEQSRQQAADRLAALEAV